MVEMEVTPGLNTQMVNCNIFTLEVEAELTRLEPPSMAIDKHLVVAEVALTILMSETSASTKSLSDLEVKSILLPSMVSTEATEELTNQNNLVVMVEAHIPSDSEVALMVSSEDQEAELTGLDSSL